MGGGSIFNPALFLLCIACLVVGMDALYAHANLELTDAGKLDDYVSRLVGTAGIHTFTVGSTEYAAVTTTRNGGVQILQLTNDAGTAMFENPAPAGNVSLGVVYDVDIFTVGSITYAAVPTYRGGIQILQLTNDTGTGLLNNPESVGYLSLRRDGMYNIDTFTVGSVTYAAVSAYFNDSVQIFQLTNDAGTALLTNPAPAGKVADTAELVFNGPRGIHTFTVGSVTYAAVVGYQDDGVQILKLTDDTGTGLLTNPAPAGKVADTAELELNGAWGVDIFTVGSVTYASVTGQSDIGVQILKLTNDTGTGLLTNPAPAGKVDDDESLLLRHPAGVHTFTVGSVKYASVTGYSDDGVQILKLTNDAGDTLLANPADAGKITDTAELELNGAWGVDIFTVGSVTYASVTGNVDRGVQILKLTNDTGTGLLTNPAPAGKVDDVDSALLYAATGIHTFTVGSTKYAAVASTRDDGVQILKLTNDAGTGLLTNPALAGKVADTVQLELDGANGIHIFTIGAAKYAAVASTDDDGVQILKLTNDAGTAMFENPAPAGKVDDDTSLLLDGAWDVDTFTVGSVTYAAVTTVIDDGVQILKLTDDSGTGLLTNPAPAGKVADTAELELNGAAGIHTFMVGSITYAAVSALSDDGVQILKLTDDTGTGLLTNPAPAGKVDDDTSLLLDGARDVDIFTVGSVTYVAVAASHDDGVQILQLTNDAGTALLTNPVYTSKVADTAELELSDAVGIHIFTIGSVTYTAVASPIDDGVQILKLTDDSGTALLTNPAPAGKITDTAELELNGAAGIDIFTVGSITYAAVASSDDSGVQMVGMMPKPVSTSVYANLELIDAGKITDAGQLELDRIWNVDMFTVGSITYAAVASSGDDGVQILKLTDDSGTALLTNPAPAGKITDTAQLELNSAWNVHTFTVGSATYAAVASSADDGVQILKLTNDAGDTLLANPADAGKITDTAQLDLDGAAGIDIFTVGSVTYAAVASTRDDGVQILKLTNDTGTGLLTNPDPAGKLADTAQLELHEPRDITIFTVGSVTYAAVASTDDDGVQILKLTNDAGDTLLANPADAGKITDTAQLELEGAFGIHTFTVGSVTYAAVVGYQDDGVQILKLTNDAGDTLLANPADAGKMDDDTSLLLDSARDIGTFTIGSVTYAAVVGYQDDGVQILKLTDDSGTGLLTNPAPAGKITDTAELELNGAAGIDIFTVGSVTYAAVASSADNGVQIIGLHLSNPLPTIVSTAGTSGSTTGTTPVPFSISFDKAVTGFTSSDITVGGTSTPGAVTSFTGSGAGPYTFTIAPGSDGTITIGVSANVATISGSTIGNAATTFSITYSSLVPTISSTAGTSGSTTGTTPVPFSISFDKAVTGFTSSDITVGGTSTPGAVTSFTGSGAGPYTFTIAPGSDGTITIDIAANVATVSGGTLGNAAATTFSITYSSLPVPTISSTAGSSGATTGTTPVPFSISFDKAVTGFTSSDITVGGTSTPGAITSFTGSGAGPYTFTIAPGSDGTITIDIAANVATVSGGTLGNAAATTFSITYSSLPVPTISSTAGSSGATTGTTPVPFSVSFSKSVTGFNATDVTVGGTSTPGAVTSFTGSGAGPYTFSITPGSDGTITIGITANVTTPSGTTLGNAAATTFTITYSSLPVPTISSNAGTSGSTIDVSPIPFSISFDKAVTGFTSSDITVGGTSTPGAVTSFTGSGSGPYAFTITPGSDGTITIGVSANVATISGSTIGNAAASAFSITYSSPPAPTISSSAGATGSSTMTTPVPFSISFDKTVTGFTSSDITIGGTSTPGAVTGFAGSGSGPYTFTITPTERGTITITIPAGVASPANASATFTITYSTDPFPTITSLAGSSGSITYDSPVPFSISFDRAVTGFTASDIVVAGTANPGAITGFVGSGAGPYTFTVAPGSDGTIVLTVPDSVTTPSNAASTFTITYYVPSIPTITSSVGLPDSVTYDSPMPFSISFDKVVTGFEASDIMVQGSAAGTVTDFAGSGAGPYTFNVMPGNDGEITLSLPISVVAPANAQATFSIRYAAPPIPTITSSAGMENDVVVATPVPFSISFDKPVTGFTASDVTVSGSSGPGSVTGFAGSGAGPYTFTVLPVSDGPLVVSVPANAALPANAAATFHVTYDYVVAASDWSAKLNVRELVSGLHFGCDDNHGIASFHCTASLTESEFELDGIRYGITQVYVDTYDSDTTDTSPEGTFHFTLDPAPGPSLAGYLLSVDTSQFAFACGTMPQDTCNMTWRSINHFLNWRTDTDAATPFIPDSRTITMSLDERTVRQTAPPTTDRPDTDRPITANPVTWSTDWSPTLTVKNLDGHIRGCDNANSDASKHCSAALTRGSFELAGTTYVVSSIHYNPTEQRSKYGLPANGTLYLGLDPQAGTEFEDYTLHVGGLKLNFGSSVLGQGPSGETVWDGVSNALNHWNGAADVRVKISLSDKY